MQTVPVDFPTGFKVSGGPHSLLKKLSTPAHSLGQLSGMVGTCGAVAGGSGRTCGAVAGGSGRSHGWHPRYIIRCSTASKPRNCDFVSLSAVPDDPVDESGCAAHSEQACSDCTDGRAAAAGGNWFGSAAARRTTAVAAAGGHSSTAATAATAAAADTGQHWPRHILCGLGGDPGAEAMPRQDAKPRRLKTALQNAWFASMEARESRPAMVPHAILGREAAGLGCGPPASSTDAMSSGTL